MSHFGTAGAFAPYVNATLTVKLAAAPSVPESVDSGWIVDPSTGNYTFDPESADESGSLVEEHTYQAHLEISQPGQYNRSMATDSTTYYLVGMLLAPWSFDPLIKVNQLFDCIWNGLYGTFELLPEQSMMPEFQSLLGTRLKGIFRVSGAGIF